MFIVYYNKAVRLLKNEKNANFGSLEPKCATFQYKLHINIILNVCSPKSTIK